MQRGRFREAGLEEQCEADDFHPNRLSVIIQSSQSAATGKQTQRNGAGTDPGAYPFKISRRSSYNPWVKYN